MEVEQRQSHSCEGTRHSNEQYVLACLEREHVRRKKDFIRKPFDNAMRGGEGERGRGRMPSSLVSAGETERGF